MWFPSLIGLRKTRETGSALPAVGQFPSLIGLRKTRVYEENVLEQVREFPSLIGLRKTLCEKRDAIYDDKVSIPHRIEKNGPTPFSRRRRSEVSIPHRIEKNMGP